MEVFSRAYDYFFNASGILNSRRLPWIDYAKGIAIILVVYHHTFLGLLAAGIKVSSILINANLIVYSFRIPLFFILSGAFIDRSLEKRGLKKYIGYRSSMLLYPYILWAVIQVTLGSFFQQYTNFPNSWQNYLFIFYEPKYTAQFWYLIALYNVSVLYVILKDRLRFRTHHHLLLGGALYLLAPVLSFNSMIQEVAINYIYMAFGTAISGYVLSKENFRYLSSWKLFIILLPFFIISQLYWIRHEDIDPFFIAMDGNLSLSWVLQQDMKMLQFAAVVLVGCVFMINICFMLQKAGKVLFLRVIGYHSLYIYLMHLLFIVGCRAILYSRLGIENADFLLSVLVAVGVIGPVIAYNIFQHLNMNFLFEFEFPIFKKKRMKMA